MIFYRRGRKGRRSALTVASHSTHLVTMPTSGSRLVGIDGLRGLAALSVLIAHVHVHLGGQTKLGLFEPLVNLMGQGLTLFFALSGFLLYRPFVGSLIDSQPFPNVRRFLANRVLRIYPAYLVILVITSLVLGVAYSQSIPAGMDVGAAESTVGFMTNPVLLVLNATLLHTLLPVSIKTGLGVSWSLTVELAFYLVLPLLAFVSMKVAKRYQGRKSLLRALIPPMVLLVLGLVTKGYLYAATRGLSPAEDFYVNWGANWQAVLARSLFAHADLFAFGMGTAVLVSWERSGSMTRRARNVTLYLAWLTIPVSVLIAKISPLDDTMFALASAVLILVVCFRNANGQQSFLSKVLEFLPLRFTGLVSYSLYLWHIPVIWLLARNNWVLPSDTLWGNVGLVLAASLALASITYFLVEAPALRLKTAPTRSAYPSSDPKPELENLSKRNF